MNRHLYLTLVVAAFLTPARPLLGEQAAWRLQPGACVDGSGLFLDQLVTQLVTHTPPTPVVPHIRLAQAPGLGQANLLSRAQVIELARPFLPALDTTNWDGPTEIRVSRRAAPLTEFKLLSLLTAAVQRQFGDGGEVELRLEHPWTPVTAPDEPLNLQLTRAPDNGLLPSFTVGFEIWAGQERVGSWQVEVQAKLWRNVPVAHSLLLRGQLLHDADIVYEKRDTLIHRDIAVNLSDPSLELTENIPAGTTLPAHCLRQRPILRRGQTVDAVFRDGSLTISLKVETLEDGAVGQTVRVRNLKTNRDLFGKIQNEETVLIAL